MSNVETVTVATESVKTASVNTETKEKKEKKSLKKEIAEELALIEAAAGEGAKVKILNANRDVLLAWKADTAEIDAEIEKLMTPLDDEFYARLGRKVALYHLDK